MCTGEVRADTRYVLSLDDDRPTELALPAFDARAVARRAALPAAGVVVVVAVALLAGGPLGVLLDAGQRLLAADPGWAAAAVGAELASFAGYVALLWMI